jgi:hypothetical protein
MSDLNKNIDPDSWTPEEMLKHTYREVLSLRKELVKVNEILANDTRYEDLKKEVDSLRKDFDVDKGKRAGAMWAFGIVITAISLLINFFIGE